MEVSKTVTGSTDGHTIGPMMLINLIENAFKHGVMKSVSSSWINITVDCQANKLVISVSNKGGAKLAPGGIGLENLRGQLNHLYPGKHKLGVETKNSDEFFVDLILEK